MSRAFSGHHCAVRKAHPALNAAPRRMAGLTYVEVLIATLLIVVTLVPALEALQPGIASAGIHASRVEDHYAISGRMEDVLAQPFADLDAAATAAGDQNTASSYSDVFTFQSGRQITRAVFLSRYDSDNLDTDNDPFTGTEADLLWVRVEIIGTADGMESLLSDYD